MRVGGRSNKVRNVAAADRFWAHAAKASAQDAWAAAAPRRANLLSSAVTASSRAATAAAPAGRTVAFCRKASAFSRDCGSKASLAATTQAASTVFGVASATAPLEKPLLDWWLMVRAENISALQNRSSPLLETAWLRGGREGAYPTAFWEPCGAGVGSSAFPRLNLTT